MLEINDSNYAKKTDQGLVLIDFWAPWCGPCRIQTPILSQIEKHMGDKLSIVKMNIDENPDTPTELGIMSIPTMLIKKEGKIVDQLIGVHTKEQIMAILSKLI